MRPILQSLRDKLAARPDTEHEQAVVRLAIGALILGYLLPDAVSRPAEPHVYVFGIYLAVAALIFSRILVDPGISPTRRVLAALADIGMLTWCLAFFEERGAPFFLVYVWITLANGFRFGAGYLLFALAVSIAGFSAVLYFSDFWRAHLSFGLGLTLGLVMLSLYVRSLVRTLFDALARAESANEAKRRFISVVSHEMRTPLNAIIGMADLLRDTRMTREQADMLQTMRGSSRVMLALVEDVLDFSKIEAGKLALEKVDFDLHALVNSTCRIVSAQATGKNIDLVVSIMPQVPPAVCGDPHHLRQILLNLAVNAVKFTERGSVTVHVSTQGETDSRIRLKFSIRDTGIGIPPEAQKRIFESFTQAEQSTVRRFGGTGLGTTIAKQLVELMGGCIGLESSVGLGSTFWVELDLEKQATQPDAAGGELASARLLLVGFPESETGPLREALASWGATPVFENGIEEGARRLAAEISLAQPYHSALLYAADEASGRQLAQRFRSAAPNPSPPAILCAPPDVQVPRFVALSAGYAAVLELPFEKRQLFNVLHSVSAGGEMQEGVVRLEDYARRGASGRKLRVLVADDNPTNREVIGKILERGGHAATVVSDGEDALDALEQASYDIVLLDRNMPRMGGIETLQAIRMMGRGLERIPVIVLSADVTPEARRECLEKGADAFLAKPIEALRLLGSIEELAEKGVGARMATPAGDSSARSGSQPETGLAALNHETLGHLEELGSGREFVERLFGIFLSDNVVLLKKIETALVARNPGEFRNHLHAMKGSAASLGADRLTRLCTVIGRLSDNELKLQSAGLVKSIGDEFAAVRVEAEAYLRDKMKSSG